MVRRADRIGGRAAARDSGLSSSARAVSYLLSLRGEERLAPPIKGTRLAERG